MQIPGAAHRVPRTPRPRADRRDRHAARSTTTATCGPTPQAKNITLTAVADHFGVWPNDISRLERGLKRDDTLATNYRQCLNTQLIDAA